MKRMILIVLCILCVFAVSSCEIPNGGLKLSVNEQNERIANAQEHIRFMQQVDLAALQEVCSEKLLEKMNGQAWQTLSNVLHANGDFVKFFDAQAAAVEIDKIYQLIVVQKVEYSEGVMKIRLTYDSHHKLDKICLEW